MSLIMLQIVPERSTRSEMERLKGLEPSTFSLGSEKTRAKQALMGGLA
jgi:hypothetical protein